MVGFFRRQQAHRAIGQTDAIDLAIVRVGTSLPFCAGDIDQTARLIYAQYVTNRPIPLRQRA